MRFAVRVVPGSVKASVQTAGEGMLKVKVDAPPEKGKANARLVEILAEHFSVAKSAIHIVHGTMGREKVVEIQLPATP